MRRLRIAWIAAVSSIAFVQIVSAADLPVKAPVAAPAPYNWTGFYIGANVGGGWGHRNVDYTANDPATAALFAASAGGAPPATSFRTSGALGGLQLGYNWQVAPAWLFGLETDFDWSGIKGSGSSSNAVGGNAVTNTVDERIKWFGTVRARLGYLTAPNLLTYVTGGFAYGRVERTGNYNVGAGGGFLIAVIPVTTCAPNSTCFSGSSSTVETGWTLGGGLEYAVARNWTLKAEYLYVSLGGGKSLTETATTSIASFNANFNRTNFNVARVGVNYRF